jgi:hypothetical protein
MEPLNPLEFHDGIASPPFHQADRKENIIIQYVDYIITDISSKICPDN